MADWNLAVNGQQPFWGRTVEVIMNPRVQSVVPKDDFKLPITFTNGEVGIFDCGHLVDFGVFREFRDVGYFSSARVAHGTVVWPHDQDICPDTLYEDSSKTPAFNAEQGDAHDGGIGSGGTAEPVVRRA